MEDYFTTHLFHSILCMYRDTPVCAKFQKIIKPNFDTIPYTKSLNEGLCPVTH